MLLNVLSILIVSVVILVYYYIKKKQSYWAERGVPFVEPEFFFGNSRGIERTRNESQVLKAVYDKLKGQDVICGVYFFITPLVVPLDLDLLKHVLIKDFEYFHDRGVYFNEKDDPLSAHLANLEGTRWKNLRMKLTPTFTSGKMKMMHLVLMQVADQLKDYLAPLAERGSDVAIKEVLSRFTTDVIGSAAFGIECNSLKDPNSEFRFYAKKIFEPLKRNSIKMQIMQLFPDIGEKLKFSFKNPEVTDFFMRILKETVEYREKNNVQRKDFLSLLMQIKNSGKIDGENVDLGTMTFEEMVAQTVIFFFAGFETSSSTMNIALYELALNPDIQDRARQEVKNVLEQHNGVISYEAAMSLTYIDQVIKETLRKYPVAPTLRRKVKYDYKVPNTKHVLKEGLKLRVPILAIHHDPEYYPEPDKFDPERFTPENIANRHPFAWIPFGEGPRSCIGLRFGMMQTRMGLATILNNFAVSVCPKTEIPMTFKPRSSILLPATESYLRIDAL